MIRALLFDFDGLIVDTETPSYASWQEVYRQHGHELPLDRWAAVIGTIGGLSRSTTWSSCTGRSTGSP